ncbi:putative signal transducing protein [Anaerocolumna jejuensis]|uniref:putative signal transducing protein n=1 Tax=Anaerocolumna jejuensis TaxID=259063 RepID=UPI003F7C08E4
MYCPNCKKEYEAGITVCPDCKKDLTAQRPEDDRVDSAASDPVKVTSAANDIDAGLIMNLLINNNIPCFKKDIGAGGYMNVYMGYSVYGEDIYVDRKDYEAALDLIGSLEPDKESVENESIDKEAMDAEEDQAEYKLPFYKNPRVVARIIVVIIGLGMIFSGIIGLLDK